MKEINFMQNHNNNKSAKFNSFSYLLIHMTQLLYQNSRRKQQLSTINLRKNAINRKISAISIQTFQIRRNQCVNDRKKSNKNKNNKMNDIANNTNRHLPNSTVHSNQYTKNHTTNKSLVTNKHSISVADSSIKTFSPQTNSHVIMY